MLFQYEPISLATSGMSPGTGLAFPTGPFIVRTQVEHLVRVIARCGRSHRRRRETKGKPVPAGVGPGTKTDFSNGK